MSDSEFCILQIRFYRETEVLWFLFQADLDERFTKWAFRLNYLEVFKYILLRIGNNRNSYFNSWYDSDFQFYVLLFIWSIVRSLNLGIYDLEFICNVKNR